MGAISKFGSEALQRNTFSTLLYRNPKSKISEMSFEGREASRKNNLMAY